MCSLNKNIHLVIHKKKTICYIKKNYLLLVFKNDK